jgi:hypothetical protein
VLFIGSVEVYEGACSSLLLKNNINMLGQGCIVTLIIIIIIIIKGII